MSRDRPILATSAGCLARSCLPCAGYVDELVHLHCSTFSLAELKAKLGDSSGMWLWEIVRGLDYTEGPSIS